LKALIIQNKEAGEILASSVIANNLKKIYPDIKIDFLCYKKSIGLLQKNPNIDRIFTINSRNLYSFLTIFLVYKYIKLIRSEKYDILIDPYQHLSSAVLSLFSKVKKRYSFNHRFFGKCYDSLIPKVIKPVTQTCNLLENRLNLLQPFLKDNPVPLNPQTKIYLTEDEIQDAGEKLAEAGIRLKRPVIMLGVLGSSVHKTWTLGNMAKLIDFIWLNCRADLLLNYLPNQKENVQNLLSLLNTTTKVYTQPVGNSIREFSAIMKNCTLYIGNEGRGVIISKALQKPTFTIFAPYTLRREIACFENTPLHRSVHLQDYLPNLFRDFDPIDLYKDSSKFYLMLSPDFVMMKLKPFLEEHLSVF
jgi:heptosyltransferase-2